jgi:hypothetical protein
MNTTGVSVGDKVMVAVSVDIWGGKLGTVSSLDPSGKVATVAIDDGDGKTVSRNFIVTNLRRLAF